MPNQSLTVIIVSYNSFNALQRCMDAWLKNPTCKIIIVDNASSDNSATNIIERYPALTVYRETINLGYGRGANKALQNVSTPYALLLNPDMMASEEDAFRLYRQACKQGDNLAILAPAVDRKDYLQKGIEPRQWVLGAAMLFNMNALRQVGWFDENIFLFAEETDLCRRIVARGFDICLDTDHYIEHLSKQSSSPNPAVEWLKNWHMGWSRTYYRHKYGLNHGKKADWRMLSQFFIKSLIATSKEKRYSYRAKLYGMRAYRRGEPAFQADGQPQQLPPTSG